MVVKRWANCMVSTAAAAFFLCNAELAALKQKLLAGDRNIGITGQSSVVVHLRRNSPWNELRSPENQAKSQTNYLPRNPSPNAGATTADLLVEKLVEWGVSVACGLSWR
jgi:hypothetical protein